MIRLIVFLALLVAIALGFSWLADRPGEIVLTWQGYRIETSVLVGLAAVAAVALAFVVLWSFLRFVLRIPSLVALTTRARRRNKGHNALTRGMIAAAAGDTRYAARATREAEKLLGEEPMILLLRAQTAQLTGDRHLTEKTFARMVERPETRLLGLRGLYAESRRRGDEEAAHLYAAQAHRIAPLGWAGDALLDYHVSRADWPRALDVVESNRTHKGTDKATADRQRAVLLTASARQNAERDSDDALRRAREASKLAPDLVPAVELAGRLLARRGNLRKAARVLENGWRACRHPDLAAAYLDLRPGDSARDRLERAQTLARIAPGDSESLLTLGRAALEARDFERARRTLAPLLSGGASARPTLRTCLLMADLEEAEHGPDTGSLREWLARAARAPRDPVWIADGVLSDRWEPASPVTGKLDAFQWLAPTERLSAPAHQEPLANPEHETKPVALPPAEPAPEPAPAIPEPVATAAPEPALSEPPAPAPVTTESAPAVVEQPAPLPEPVPLVTTEPRAIQPAAIRRPTGSALYPMPALPDDPGPEPLEETGTPRRFFP
ncbi:MAG: heme biosynthesis protein HemY [Hyphomicrobiales bacterium]|nr:heme biosynthesis protein HemY [Hyphomicrobiales bacterium]